MTPPSARSRQKERFDGPAHRAGTGAAYGIGAASALLAAAVRCVAPGRGVHHRTDHPGRRRPDVLLISLALSPRSRVTTRRKVVAGASRRGARRTRLRRPAVAEFHEDRRRIDQPSIALVLHAGESREVCCAGIASYAVIERRRPSGAFLEVVWWSWRDTDFGDERRG